MPSLKVRFLLISFASVICMIDFDILIEAKLLQESKSGETYD